MPDGSYSVSAIQYYIDYIRKKHEITDPPIYIYSNMINNRLVFKIKDIYKPKLQAPETMNLFGGTKNLMNKPKNGEN